MSGLIVPGQPEQPPTPPPAAPGREQLGVMARQIDPGTIALQLQVGTALSVTIKLPIISAPQFGPLITQVIGQAMSGLLVAEAQPPKDLFSPNGGPPGTTTH